MRKSEIDYPATFENTDLIRFDDKDENEKDFHLLLHVLIIVS